jgi:predicted secreted protein
MKNFLKTGLMTVAFLTTFGASANEKDFSLKVKSEKGKTVSFSINEAKDVNLSIYSKDNETLFGEKVTANGLLSRTYDLKAFPEGDYILEVETSAKMAQYAIHISGNSAVISEVAIAEVFKPVFANENGIVSLNISNADKSPVEIKLVDENNNELYSEVFTGKSSISKRFDTNKTFAGNLTFVVKYKDQIFAETVAMR